MTLIDLQEYVKNYNRAIYRLRAMGRSAPTELRLSRFEESIDFEFPKEFRELTLSPLAGLCLEVPEELWPRPTSDDAEWKRQFNVRVFSLGVGIPSWLDLLQELNALPPEETDLIPFMALGTGTERYCFDLDHNIVRWTPAGTREVLDVNLYALILAEFAQLEERWEHLKEDAAKQKKSRKRKKVKAGAC